MVLIGEGKLNCLRGGLQKGKEKIRTPTEEMHLRKRTFLWIAEVRTVQKI